jgi:small-conductance mechanosensitive channel/CRP-like cAMP-binding protein
LWHELLNPQHTLRWVALGVVVAGVLYALAYPTQRVALRLVWLALLLATGAQAVVLASNPNTNTAFAAHQAVVLLLGWATIQVLVVWVFRGMLPLLGLQPPRIAQDLSSTGLALAWGLVWLRMLGVDPTQLFATSAIITAVLAFAMQDTLGNVLGGVTLQLDHSLRVGDWVRADDINGRVIDVRWRYTSIETRNQELVIIPNSWLMKNRFTVLRKHGDNPLTWRRQLPFHVDAEADPAQVIQVLEHAVLDADITDVLHEPPPSAVLTDVQAGYCSYTLRYWLTNPAQDDPCDSAVRQHALAALTRAGLRLGVHREERLTISDHSWRISAEQRESERRLAAIRQTELFAHLPPAEQLALAHHLERAPFAAGDTITRQGAVAHWLYLIIHGQAQVLVDGPRGRIPAGVLHDGDFFGELGMLTGAPRQATVRALSAIDCYRLDKAGFAQVIQARPELAREISAIVQARKAQLTTTPPLPGLTPPAPSDLLDRIRSFFALSPSTHPDDTGL